MKGTLAGFLTLTHFGRTDEDPEERTVHFWILPGDMAGLPVDEPGCVLLRGWPKHDTTKLVRARHTGVEVFGRMLIVSTVEEGLTKLHPSHTTKKRNLSLDIATS
jgi:hypothetical protein